MNCSSGKIGFRNQNEATKSTKGLRRNKGINMKSYLCPECGEWHRTSCNKKHFLSGALRKTSRKAFQKLKLSWRKFTN